MADINPFKKDSRRRISEVVRYVESQPGFNGVVNRAARPNVAWRGTFFLNDSGETVPAYAIMAVVDAEIYTDFEALSIEKPGTTFRRRYVVNGPLTVAAGEIGTVQEGELVRVLYDSGTPAANEGWGPKPSQWSASKGFLGIVLAHGVVDSTNKVLSGLLNSWPTSLLVKTTGAVTGGTSGTTAYKIYTGTSGSEADSGFTTVPTAISRVDIDSGLWCKLTWINNGWIIEPLECNA